MMGTSNKQENYVLKCDSCGKLSTCVEKKRHYDEDFYNICCKCLILNSYFWRKKNKTIVCKHISVRS